MADICISAVCAEVGQATPDDVACNNNVTLALLVTSLTL